MKVKITKKIAPAFSGFVFDWDYETYLLCGGYGSGKSYHVAFKIILKCLEEKRKVLVVREVYETIADSCYDLFREILLDMGLYTENRSEFYRKKNRVWGQLSPLRFRFPNGSTIIFRGMDKPEKVKSINGVSIVWLEEASEIKYSAFQELQGRLRTPDVSMHFFLSCNPVGRENWIYQRFFKFTDDDGKERLIMDEEKFYERKELIGKNGVYYHHSTPSDNPWLPWRYIKRLDDLRHYDYPLYMVARWGRFGATGTRVLPQMRISKRADQMKKKVMELGFQNMYFGFDFGFEESFNAVVCMSVDRENQVLYVWDEIYMNHITDDKFAALPEMQKLRRRVNDVAAMGLSNGIIVADNADPKAIQYYRQQGFRIRACKNKFVGSRLSNTRKVKRFKKVIVSSKCKNTIRELKDLTYKKDAKGNVIYDQFNIDPHTFSAIWYGLDTVTVADYKDRKYYSKAG